MENSRHTDFDRQYDELLRRLDSSFDKPRQELAPVLHDLITLAERGYYPACEAIAETLAVAPSVRDAEEAYVWYFVACKFDGYSTILANKGSAEYYLGGLDDFRNEPMVSGLVDEIGISRLEDLDRRAKEWMKAHPALQS